MGAPQVGQHLIEPRAQHLGSFGLSAAKPDMASDRIPAASFAELPVQGYQDGILIIGIHRQVVILGLSSKPGLVCGPALVAFANEHASDADGDILVKKEAHGRPSWAQPVAVPGTG
jgi:hypothetical protein